MKIEYFENMTMSDLVKKACKMLGSKESYKMAKLYNKGGVQFFKDDMQLVGAGDVLYLALKGKAGD